ncbi:MAG: cell division protein FtsA, partial [Nitrospiraceae bacterium]|nr:cell division protein FtsA [Nitrospiraceae bacterium]
MVNDRMLVIDLGTSSIRTAVISTLNGKKSLTVSVSPSRGIKGGNIVNVQSATDALRASLNKLKLESPVSIPNEAYVLITGAHTLSYNVESSKEFPGIQSISYADVNDIKGKAKSDLLKKLGQAIRQHYEIIHIIPQEFKVDNLSGIQNPIGHSGKTLGMRAFVVLASKSSIGTISSLLEHVNLKLRSLVVQSLASSYGIRDDKTYLNNNLIVYLGAGNTEYMLFKEDKPALSGNLPFGGDDIVDFIVSQLKVNRKEAERLFLNYATAYALNVDKEKVITVNYGAKLRKIPEIYISILVHFQLKKRFKDIKQEIESKDPSYISNLNRIYLTGGLTGLKDIDLLSSK